MKKYLVNGKVKQEDPFKTLAAFDTEKEALNYIGEHIICNISNPYCETDISVMEDYKESPKHKNPLKVQVAGNHYKDFKIQPIEFIHKNKLSFIQGNIIKYICRYDHKNGLEDLKKVKHYVDLLINFEYPDGDK